MSGKPTIFQIDRLDLRFAPKPWDFAVTRRPESDAYFAELQRQKPEVWNGRVLLLHSQVVRDGVFHGAYLEADFASFTAWRHWGSPPSGVLSRRIQVRRKGITVTRTEKTISSVRVR